MLNPLFCLTFWDFDEIPLSCRGSLLLYFIYMYMYLSFFFLQRRHEWHQSHPYDKCQSLWRITLIYSVLLNTTDVNIAFQWKLSFLKFPRIFTYKWQFSYFSVLFVPLQYCILSLEKKRQKKKNWEKQLCTVATTWWNLMCMCLRSFQGHSGGVEHLSFDGSTIISASTDL